MGALYGGSTELNPGLLLIAEPTKANDYWPGHAALLLASYQHWTGRALLKTDAPGRDLYHAPFALLSHDMALDPCFTYANLAAQTLFEMPWAEMVGSPSRHSAEPLAQSERASLLARVAAQGYIDNYSGVRITRSGKRFRIQHATVWNLIAQHGALVGQAACFTADSAGVIA